MCTLREMHCYAPIPALRALAGSSERVEQANGGRRRPPIAARPGKWRTRSWLREGPRELREVFVGWRAPFAYAHLSLYKGNANVDDSDNAVRDARAQFLCM